MVNALFFRSKACRVSAARFACRCQQLDHKLGLQQPRLYAGRCWLRRMAGKQQREHLVQETYTLHSEARRILGFQVSLSSRETIETAHALCRQASLPLFAHHLSSVTLWMYKIFFFFSGYMCCHICRDSKGEFYGQYNVLRQPSYVVSRTLIAFSGAWCEDSVIRAFCFIQRKLFFMSRQLICSAKKLSAAVSHW